MNTIKYKDILKTYQRIDLYRAKYRHDDFTPHAWCFHGNQAQSWNGLCQGSFLRFKNTLLYNNSISIDTATYKYLSFKFYTPGYTPKFLRYKLIINYTNTEVRSKEVIIPYDGQLTTVFLDMSEDLEWTGNVKNIGFTLNVETSENVWGPTAAEIYVEYIKFDKENVFANVLDANTVTIADFNEMRGDVETFTKQSIDWPGPDRVRQFIDTIKKTDISEVSNKIGTLAPYNGCATCDGYTCTCDSLAYGYTACKACNACNQHQTCSICDQTCHEQARSCSCNATCFTQGKACTCNGTCYGYSACSCDWTCYSCYAGNTYCSINNIHYQPITTCPCHTSSYGMDCRYEQTDYITTCNLCFQGCDVASEVEGCRTNVINGFLTCLRNAGECCSCNEACNQQGADPNTQLCDKACFVVRWLCTSADTTQVTTTCSTCDMRTYSMQTECSPCYVGYGGSGCYSCNTICYGQPTACACNNLCYTQARSCTCNARCNQFQACTVCDGCDGYVPCTCNATCHQQSCEQCHKAGYSSVPI